MVLCSLLVSEVLDRAQGVWLWVILVVRELLKGLRNRNTAAILLARLRQIPQELSDLFLQMISRIEMVYLPEALTMLQIALKTPTSPTLVTYSFSDEEKPNFAAARKQSANDKKEIRLD